MTAVRLALRLPRSPRHGHCRPTLRRLPQCPASKRYLTRLSGCTENVRPEKPASRVSQRGVLDVDDECVQSGLPDRLPRAALRAASTSMSATPSAVSDPAPPGRTGPAPRRCAGGPRRRTRLLAPLEDFGQQRCGRGLSGGGDQQVTNGGELRPFDVDGDGLDLDELPPRSPCTVGQSPPRWGRGRRFRPRALRSWRTSLGGGDQTVRECHQAARSVGARSVQFARWIKQPQLVRPPMMLTSESTTRSASIVSG